MRARGVLISCAVVAATAAAAHAGSNPRQYDGTYQLRAPLIPARLTVSCTGAPAQSIPIPVTQRTIHVLNGILQGRRIDAYGDISYTARTTIGGATVLAHSKWS